MAKRKIASISPVTGAPVAGFTANAGAQATALAATNTTVYVGGNFSTVNGAARVGLAALNAGTGAVLPGFVNDISGGIGPNGALTVQQLKLTHDDSKLLVARRGRTSPTPPRRSPRGPTPSGCARSTPTVRSRRCHGRCT